MFSRRAVASGLSAALLAAGCSAPIASDFSPSPAATSLASPPAGLPATRIPVLEPISLSAVGSTIWAISDVGVARIDASSNEVTNIAIRGGGELDDIAATPEAVWVAGFDAGQVYRIDPKTGAVSEQLNAPHAEGLLVDGTTLWVTNHHEGSVTRIDTRTGKVIGTTNIGRTGSNGPQRIVLAAGSIWIGVGVESQVVRLDPKTGAVVAKVSILPSLVPCGDLAATPAAIWITGCHETATIGRIDPATNKLVFVTQLDGSAQRPVVIDGFIWVAVATASGSVELQRIDPATNAVDRTLPIQGAADVAGSVLVGRDYWLADGVGAVLRIPITELGGP